MRCFPVLLVLAGALAAQPTTPPADNDRTLRPLGPNEIPPNLSFYAMDPLYKPGVPLGWATERIEEKLDRGLVALPASGKTYLSWRLLKSDAPATAFNVYRVSGGGTPVRVNKAPVAKTTDFVDSETAGEWFVRPLVNGREGAESERVAPLSATYRAIRLRDITKGVDRVGIGDLNGDGAYDFVVKHPVGAIDPGRFNPSPATYKIDAYDGKSGRFLWRVDLGWNIDQGIWFSPMVVRDLDGDGKAEVCLRTAPFAATREERLGNPKGFVLEGPEYLSVYDGETGKELDKVDWIERGKTTEWADYTVTARAGTCSG